MYAALNHAATSYHSVVTGFVLFFVPLSCFNWRKLLHDSTYHVMPKYPVI